jgi:hypothetical protein
MKRTPALVASAIALTLVFYMASTYLLPGPPPSMALVGLFAAIALALVFAGSALWRRLRGAKPAPDAGRKAPGSSKTHGLILCALAGMMAVAMQGCKTGAPSPGSASSASRAVNRVTGFGYLLSGTKEEEGYGLYSYALLSHPPSALELPQYSAFLKALVALPTAKALEQYVPRQRINLTSIPVTETPPTGADDAKVTYILAHYDYARAAVLKACLTTRTGPGPVLVSVLQPIDPSAHPTPVLVQDLTRAQASLMETYVESFVSQVAQDRFWEQSSLAVFALNLRNSLETAAVGLGMSKTAVDGWIKFLGKSAPAATKS